MGNYIAIPSVTSLGSYLPSIPHPWAAVPTSPPDHVARLMSPIGDYTMTTHHSIPYSQPANPLDYVYYSERHDGIQNTLVIQGNDKGQLKYIMMYSPYVDDHAILSEPQVNEGNLLSIEKHWHNALLLTETLFTHYLTLPTEHAARKKDDDGEVSINALGTLFRSREGSLYLLYGNMTTEPRSPNGVPIVFGGDYKPLVYLEQIPILVEGKDVPIKEMALLRSDEGVVVEVLDYKGERHCVGMGSGGVWRMLVEGSDPGP